MTTPDPNAPTPQTQTTSPLEALVGPDKKFQSVEDLARGKLEADNYITKIVDENKQLRTVVTAQDRRLASLESKLSILDRLETPPNTGNPGVPVQQSQPQTPAAPSLTEEDVLKLVEQRDVNAKAQANKVEVDQTLNKVLGANAAGFVLQKAAELGVTPAYLHNLALTSPKAFYATLGIDTNANQGGTMHKGGIRPTAPSAEVRNEAWYTAKKNEVGIKKFVMDKELQKQMWRDMDTLGDAFFA